MPIITLRLQTEDSLSEDEIEALAESIQQIDPSYEVEIAEPPFQTGSASFLWEVISAYVPWHDITSAAAGVAVTKITDAFVEWACNYRKGWLRRFGKEHSDLRNAVPVELNLYGPNGEVLKTIIVHGLNEVIVKDERKTH